MAWKPPETDKILIGDTEGWSPPEKDLVASDPLTIYRPDKPDLRTTFKDNVTITPQSTGSIAMGPPIENEPKKPGILGTIGNVAGNFASETGKFIGGTVKEPAGTLRALAEGAYEASPGVIEPKSKWQQNLGSIVDLLSADPKYRQNLMEKGPLPEGKRNLAGLMEDITSTKHDYATPYEPKTEQEARAKGVGEFGHRLGQSAALMATAPGVAGTGLLAGGTNLAIQSTAASIPYAVQALDEGGSKEALNEWGTGLGIDFVLAALTKGGSKLVTPTYMRSLKKTLKKTTANKSFRDAMKKASHEVGLDVGKDNMPLVKSIEDMLSVTDQSYKTIIEVATEDLSKEGLAGFDISNALGAASDNLQGIQGRRLGDATSVQNTVNKINNNIKALAPDGVLDFGELQTLQRQLNQELAFEQNTTLKTVYEEYMRQIDFAMYPRLNRSSDPSVICDAVNLERIRQLERVMFENMPKEVANKKLAQKAWSIAKPVMKIGGAGAGGYGVLRILSGLGD